MKSISGVVASILLFGFGNARAQDVGSQSFGQVNGQAQAQIAQPQSPPPSQTPTPPPQQLPPPPQQQTVPTEAQSPPPATGQWVYTAQYGWIWLPYGSEYTNEPTTAGTYPYEYAYDPGYGLELAASAMGLGFGRGSLFWSLRTVALRLVQSLRVPRLAKSGLRIWQSRLEGQWLRRVR